MINSLCFALFCLPLFIHRDFDSSTDASSDDPRAMLLLMLLKSRSIGSPPLRVSHGLYAISITELRLAGSFSSIPYNTCLISIFSISSKFTGSLDRSWVFRFTTALPLIGYSLVMSLKSVTPAAQMSAFICAYKSLKCDLPCR